MVSECMMIIAITSLSNSHDNEKQWLRIVLFGPPFAGKTTHVKRLATKYQLCAFSASELLQNAIADGNMSLLGQEIAACLQQGAEITPQHYSQLVLDAIQTLERDELNGTRTSTCGGWLICDLPATKDQFQCLEEVFTGFIDPKFIPSPLMVYR